MEKEKYLHDDETTLSKKDERKFALMGLVLMALGTMPVSQIKQEAIDSGLLESDEEWAHMKDMAAKVMAKNTQLLMAAVAEVSKESKTAKA